MSLTDTFGEPREVEAPKSCFAFRTFGVDNITTIGARSPVASGSSGDRDRAGPVPVRVDLAMAGARVRPENPRSVGRDHVTEVGWIDRARRSAECRVRIGFAVRPVSYTHLRAHETVLDLVCRL